MNKEAIALSPGTMVADLQISEVLGVGSFGITYLVTDPVIGTRFALKEYFPTGLVTRNVSGSIEVLKPDLALEFADGLALFLNEARLAGGFDHPNVMKVLRFFQENGTAYYLMPYYPGQTLQQLLEASGPLKPEAIRPLLLPAMDALEYIHAQGVIHQDIKPANVLISQSGQPILLDFGAAAANMQDTKGASRLGSHGYAAPEQSDPDANVGPWTDIYSLAATLYRAATGVIPAEAVSRLSALAAGDKDPVTRFKDMVPEGQYGGIRDAIELGMSLSPQDRPQDVTHWKKSFRSLDWLRSVSTSVAADEQTNEGKEWLPKILLGAFVVAMLVIAGFLLTDKSDSDVISLPDFSADRDRPALSGRGGFEEPTAEETMRWYAALDADTINGYRRFIADYPKSVYRPQAETQLDILDEAAWARLSPENTIAAYEDYLELFPDGLHQTEAMSRIEKIREEEARKERERLEQQKLEQEAWDKASSTRTIPAFDEYISAWPAGKHIEEANRIRRLLLNSSSDNQAFESASRLNTKASLQAYLDAYPQGRHVAAALEMLDKLDLRPGKTFRDCDECPEMKVIPAGTYWQGSEEDSSLALSMEKPRRQVTITEPFAVGVYEITMAQWDACVADKGCTENPPDNNWGRGQRPVIMVSWNDAQTYVSWLSDKTQQSYRLPSESEWEYFSRAGEQSDWPGGTQQSVCDYANIAGSETGFKWQHTACNDKLALGTATAGTYKANGFGLFDTIGNVAEWTADCMNLSYLDAPVDGSAWGRGICSSHITRGGSWVTGSREIRLPSRFNLKNGDRNDFTGFRVVRKVTE
jgi:formylglycine-generating enzyme required for sulfatase activity/serine/threonine protein kinase